MEVALNKKSNDKFDIFVSHPMNIQDKIYTLYRVLVSRYAFNIYIDKDEDHQNLDNFRISHIIRNSIMMICCVNRAYLLSDKVKNELTIAYANDKPIVCLLFEKMSVQELGTISFALEIGQTCNIYDEKMIDGTWNEASINKIVNCIEGKLSKKLILLDESVRKRKKADFFSKIKQINMKKRLDKPLTSVISGTVHKQEKQRNNEVIDTFTILSIIAEEIFAKPEQVVRNKLFFVSPTQIKLEHFKSNSLIDLTFGFNRIIYLESRSRYIFTSAHKNHIISIDTNGNWIEKRNPCGMLKKPWSICLNRKNEIFIGDNEAKCVFVFDSRFNYLRSIAQDACFSYFDLAIDDETNDIYVADYYEAMLAIISIESSKLKKKIYMVPPAFVRLTKEKIFVVSSTDLIFVIDKNSYQVNHTIQMENTKYVNGLYIDTWNRVFTTCHHFDDDDNKSREVYLNIINLTDEFNTKRINLGITQVNDLLVFNDRLIAINDTHFEFFNCSIELDRKTWLF